MGFRSLYRSLRRRLLWLSQIHCTAGRWFPTTIALIVLTGCLFVGGVLVLRRGSVPFFDEQGSSAFAFPAPPPLPPSGQQYGTQASDKLIELTPLEAFPDSTEDFRKATEFWLAKGNMPQASSLLAQWPDTEDSRNGLLKAVSIKVANRWKGLLENEIGVLVAGNVISGLSDKGAIENGQVPTSVPDALAFAVTSNVAVRCQQEHADTPAFMIRAFAEHSLMEHPVALLSWGGPEDQFIPYTVADEAMRNAFLERHVTGPFQSMAEQFATNWRQADAPIRDWISSKLGTSARRVEEILSRDPPANDLPEQLLDALPKALSNTWRYEVRVRLQQNDQLSQILEADEKLALVTAPIGNTVLTKNQVIEIAVSSPLWHKELSTLNYERALGALPEILAFFGVDRASSSIRKALWLSLNQEYQALTAENFPWLRVCTILKVRMPPRQWRGLNHMSKKHLQQLAAFQRTIGDVSPVEMAAALREVASAAKAEADRTRMLEVASLYATNRGLLSAPPGAAE